MIWREKSHWHGVCGPQATVFIDLLINTYSSAFCRSGVYPCCKCCEFCAVNEYYYRKKYELVMEPKSVRLLLSDTPPHTYTHIDSSRWLKK